MNAPQEVTIAMIRESLYVAVISDALDALGFTNQCPRIPLRRFTGADKLVGRCKTTLWADMAHPDPKPYELELTALDACRPDDVIIAAAAGSLRSGIWGELLSTAAKNRDCAGAIIHGAVRDIAKMNAMNFTVFAAGASPYDSLNRQRVIDLDVPVEIDAVRFAPGDLVIADEDGVVVIPQHVEHETLQRAWEKVHKENITRDAIKAGMGAMEAWRKYGIL